MMRPVSLASLVMVASLLAACSGQSPYCRAVDAQKSVLDSFGAERTDAAYARYAKALSSVAAEAPSTSRTEWAAAAKATRAVVEAHEKVGYRLDDMADEEKRAGLSEGDVEILNRAYAAFNDSLPDRRAAVADARATCDIKLK